MSELGFDNIYTIGDSFDFLGIEMMVVDMCDDTLLCTYKDKNDILRDHKFFKHNIPALTRGANPGE